LCEQLITILVLNWGKLKNLSEILEKLMIFENIIFLSSVSRLIDQHGYLLTIYFQMSVGSEYCPPKISCYVYSPMAVVD